jgi:hypothetical protein
VGCSAAAHPSFVVQRRVGIPRSVNASEVANLPVYFVHGQRRHRAPRGNGQPQGSRAAYQGDPEPHALQGMTDGENHRDLLTRLSTALAMTEAA